MQLPILFVVVFVVFSSNIFVQHVDALEGYEADEIRRIFEDVLETRDKKFNEKLDLILRLIGNVAVNGKTPLHTLVTLNGTEEDILMILDSGVNINEADKANKRTPLHYAASNGNKKLAELFIKYGAEVNALDKDHQTPLMLALTNDHGDVGDLLARNGANYSIATDTGYTLLHYAVTTKNDVLIDKILAYGVDVNARAFGRLTPLMLAVSRNDSFVPIVEKLIKNGADLAARSIYQDTALHQALTKDNIEIVKTLLKYGADPNAIGFFDETPVDLLKRKRDVIPHYDEILTVLRDSGAKSRAEI